MSTAVQTCVCDSIGADPSVVRFAECHHRYFRGDRQLASVTSVIRETWPIKKNFENADPEVLEHARERGIRVDTYFSEYLRSGTVRILAGEWREVVDRVKAVIEWWTLKHAGTDAIAQQMLADDAIAGTPDIITDNDFIFDMKNVSALDPSYWLQLGAYAELYEKQFGHSAQGGGFIHVKQSKDQLVRVNYVEVDLAEVIADWKTCREMWSMVQRRTKS